MSEKHILFRTAMIKIIFLILLLIAGCASTPRPEPPKVKDGISGHKFWFVGPRSP